jgi:hypothetical protein
MTNPEQARGLLKASLRKVLELGGGARTLHPRNGITPDAATSVAVEETVARF